MASMHMPAMHTRSDSGISVHSTVAQNGPPSPTLTNPDMILPRQPWQHETRDSSPLASSPLIDPDLALSRTVSATSSQRNSGGAAELGVATAVYMPSRLTAPPPTTVNRPTTPPNGLYAGYEHGAPLSDIYEESEATPKSSKASHVSRTPSPTPSLERPSTPTKSGPVLRHKKRLSALSTSSAGSDIGDWEAFDSSKVLTDRVAADIARMNRDEPTETDDAASRRNSKEEEELAVLNARAEKILENARKRLTHMEGNLKVARNSILMPSRSSPHLGDHQPVGGLYRSISAAGATRMGKSKPLYPPIKTNPNLRHARGESDTAVPSKQVSRDLEMRSASALEYNLPYYAIPSPEAGSSPPARYQHSPSSSRSPTSALRQTEEEKDNPSTTETTPESAKMTQPRGLGLHKSAAISKENLASSLERSSSRRTPTPTHLQRSSSSASTRSTKELREQMSDLKSRIADLKSQAQADNLRRRSLQNMKLPLQPDQWYTSANAYQNANGSPVSANAGIGYKNDGGSAHRRVVSDGRTGSPGQFSTPTNKRFLDVERLTPGSESALLSSARTDRNTPLLSHPKRIETDSVIGELDERDAQSIVQPSHYEDAPRFAHDQQVEDGDDEPIAENDEEQIYLNEVLEESLRDAEVEPEVPVIPAGFLENAEGLGPEAERHEDRLDAFDYENMFLHSAMGNYTGKRLEGDQSDSESEEEEDEEQEEAEDNEEDVEDEGDEGEVQDDDDNDSVETSRADMRTPTNNFRVKDEDEDENSEPDTDDEMEDVIATGKSPGLSAKGTPKANKSKIQELALQSPPKMKLPQPPKPWMKNARSNSIDSVSTAATFETATEGENDREEDEHPHEILNWGNAPRNDVQSQPSQYDYTYHQGQSISPRKNILADHAFPSPPSSTGRETPTLASAMPQQTRNPTSSLKSAFAGDRNFSGVRDMNGFPIGPGLGLGVVGAENAQYINDNGVPERFQGQPSPAHSRQGSKQSNASSHTRIPSAGGSKHSRNISHASNHSRQYSAGQSFSPSLPVPPSPTRKFVINQSLRSPQPDARDTTPPLPNSQSRHKASPSIQSQSSGSARSTPAPISYSRPRTVTPKPGTPSSQATSQTVPNTEILMESLIKLAQPSFALAEGTRFAEMDKDLVLGLLRALGGVCDGLLRAQLRGGQERERIIGDLRESLEGATGVLDGNMTINWDANEIYPLANEVSEGKNRQVGAEEDMF